MILYPVHDAGACRECDRRREALKPSCGCRKQMPYEAVPQSVRCASCGGHLDICLSRR